MQKPDVVRLTFEQNPALLDAMRQVKPGDKGEMTIMYQFKAQDEEGVDLIVEAAVPPGYEVDKTSDMSPVVGGPMGSDAVPQPAAMFVKKKSDSIFP